MAGIGGGAVVRKSRSFKLALGLAGPRVSRGEMTTNDRNREEYRDDNLVFAIRKALVSRLIYHLSA